MLPDPAEVLDREQLPEKRILLLALLLRLCVIRKTRSPWEEMRGWKPLKDSQEIPSISDDLNRLYRSYGRGMTNRKLVKFVKQHGSFRCAKAVRINEYKPLKALIFGTPSGSVMVVFPRHKDRATRSVEAYIMGETAGVHASEVGSELVELFETRFAHMATFSIKKIETMRNNIGRRH